MCGCISSSAALGSPHQTLSHSQPSSDFSRHSLRHQATHSCSHQLRTLGSLLQRRPLAAGSSGGCSTPGWSRCGAVAPLTAVESG
jgi:hypothetical protein